MLGGIEIEETNDNSNVKSLDNQIVLDRLKEFKLSIEEAGVVSKDEVLSLEEFIGVNIYSGSNNINKLTRHPSAIGLATVASTIDEVIGKIDIKDTITIRSVAVKIQEALSLISTMRSRVKILDNLIADDIVEAINDKKYRYYYKDDDKYNILDAPVLSLALEFPEYFKFISIIKNDTEYNKFITLVHNAGMDESMYGLGALNSIANGTLLQYINGSVTPEPFKVVDIVNYKQVGKKVITKSLNELMDIVMEIRDSVWRNNNTVNNLPPKQMMKANHILENLINSLSTKQDKLIFSILDIRNTVSKG